MSRLLISLCWAVLLASCHDAPRNNPFDPALTPPVVLQVALDDTAGIATLTWTQYEGQQPFREYRVLRNIADRKSVDTLVHLPAVAQITFVDTTLAPNTAYVYRVETLNASGYAAPSEEKGIAGYGAGPVNLVEVEVDAQQGQAQLRWTHFTGARFQGYRVERRSGEEERFSVIQGLAGLSDTTWTDADLAPEVSYFYQIVVEAADQDWPSNPSSRQGFALETVQLSVETNKSSGRAQLWWTRFQGPDFQGYRVERRSGEEVDFGMIGRLAVLGDTAYTDTTLAPEVSYVYRVVVEAGERDWPSAPSSRQEFELKGVNISAREAASGIRLSWPYFTGSGFQRYRVLRRVSGTDVVETVGEVTDKGTFSVAFTDTSARHGMQYEYWVVVDAAGQEVISNTVVVRFEFPKVAVELPVFSSATASAELHWSRYFGFYFRAYRVERRTAELAPQVVAELEDLFAPTYVDADLVGNTEYFYRVVVETDRDEEVESAEVSGRFHDLVSTWPLDLEAGEHVRLYWEEDRLTALVAGPGRVQLRFFDAQGQLLGEQTMLGNPFASDRLFGEWSPPQAVATTRLPDGSRLLSFADRSGELLGVLEFDIEGKLRWREEQVFTGEMEVPAEEKNYRGRWGVSIFETTTTNVGGPVIADKAAAFTAIEVTVDGVTQLQGDEFARKENWQNAFVVEFDEGLMRYSSTLGRGTVLSTIASTALSSPWERFSMHARLVLMKGNAGIIIGSSDVGSINSLIGWSLQYGLQELELSQIARSRESSRRQYPFAMLAGVPYGLRIEAGEGTYTASVEHALRWSGRTEKSAFAGLAQFGDFVGVVAGNQPFILDPEAKAEEKLPLDRPVSEVRSWERENRGRRETWAGLCLPEQHQIRYARAGVNRTTGEFSWPFDSPNLISRLGQGLGQEGGEMVFPLSFDVGPDGRFFVLDAGNGRLQVFGAEGEYLTQWGHKGSGEGEFDFGAGALGAEDLAGSVAVDEEGYIYVADVGNRRIQKFAP